MRSAAVSPPPSKWSMLINPKRTFSHKVSSNCTMSVFPYLWFIQRSVLQLRELETFKSSVQFYDELMMLASSLQSLSLQSLQLQSLQTWEKKCLAVDHWLNQRSDVNSTSPVITYNKIKSSDFSHKSQSLCCSRFILLTAELLSRETIITAVITSTALFLTNKDEHITLLQDQQKCIH